MSVTLPVTGDPEADKLLVEDPLALMIGMLLDQHMPWLPMPEGGEDEVRLTADYNLEMIEQVDRYGRVRDRSIFVGDPEEIVTDQFGPGLPTIRSWTEQHFDFAGYITGFDPVDDTQRVQLRAELGFHPDEKVCVVTVGGSGVGARRPPTAQGARRLPARPAEAPRAPHGRRRRAPHRPDPPPLGSRRPRGRRLRARPLPAPGRLRPRRRAGRSHHRHGADRQRPAVPLLPPRRPLRAALPRPAPPRALPCRRQMEYGDTDADDIATAVVEEIDRVTDYLPVASGGAARAAALLAELL